MELRQHERTVNRAREILANQTFPARCDCGAPERGHAPACSLVLAEEDAWEQAQEEAYEAEAEDDYDSTDPDLPVCCRENLDYGRPPCCKPDHTNTKRD